MKEIAKQVLKNCLGYRDGETVTIITDRITENVGSLFRDTADEMGARVNYFVMEDFGERPDDGSNPLPFPREIGEALENSDISIYAAIGKKGELISFRSQMLEFFLSSDYLRHGHMIDITEEALRIMFGDDYQKIIDLTRQVYEDLQGARSARVTTPAGTDLMAEFDPRYRWVISDGVIAPGTYSNVPSGEVFTCVGNCEGRAVIDGELGDYMAHIYGTMEDNPLSLQIENGRVVDLSCSNKAIEEEVRKYMEVDENGNRVGEWAIGTNTNVKELTGNFLIDEKIPGVHIALGSGYPEMTGVDWDGQGHLDCVMMRPTVTVTYEDGSEKVIMRDGEFEM